MSFKLLSKKIQDILNELGYLEETAPQRIAIPKILEGKNLLIISPTGTGKTEAAILPILDLLSKEERKGIRALYITPLRSLNRNLMERLTLWCSKLDLRIAVRHGDTEAMERRRQSLLPPDLLITTPETLQVLLVSKIIREHLRSVRHVIIDELHELAESKRGAQLSVALERLRLIAGEFQLIGLSATIGEPEKLAKFLVGIGRECEIINAKEERGMKVRITLPRPGKKDEELANALFTYPDVVARLRKISEAIDSKKSTLIFTNTRSEAEVLASRLRMMKKNVFVHHSSLSKEVRIDAESSLKLGEIKGIVCTSSLELGIDIGHIDYVIQYNSPRQATRLVQRIGRSRHRFKEMAEGLIVATNIDSFLESIVLTKRAFSEKYERIEIPEKPMDVLAHQLIGILIEYGRIKIDEFLNIVNKAYPFRNLKKEEIEKLIELLQSLKPKALLRFDEEVVKTQGSFMYYFENLSMIPELVKYAVFDAEKSEYIGELDEDFIAEFGEEGTRFVLKGEVWEIIAIDEEKKRILCKRAESNIGVVPTWVGEEIPVLKEVAEEVVELRKKIVEDPNIAGDFAYLDELMEISEIIKKDLENGLQENAIFIEDSEEIKILNTNLGTRANKALAKLLSYLINIELKKQFKIQSDAYRVYIFSKEVNAKEIASILRELQFRDLESMIARIINEEDNLFRFRFLQVAKRFGIVRRQASIDKKLIIELARQYKETQVYEEAFKEVVSKDIDIEGVKGLMNKLMKGEAKIKIFNGLSNMSKEALVYIANELGIAGKKDPSRFLVEVFKTRIFTRPISIACLDCKDYAEIKSIINIESIECPYCGSKRLAVSKLPISMIRKALMSSEDKGKIGRIKKRLKITSELIENKTKLAMIALSANISLKDALKILSKFDEENEDFYLELMKAESERMKRILEHLRTR